MKNLFVLTIAISFILILSCKKKEPEKSGEKLFTYNSLTSDKDTLKQGNVTNIRANVTGSDVTYIWECSSGDIFGSGSVILFGAGTCCMGNHTITCTVKDKNSNTESKSDLVLVN
jgi:hypothetical protein